MNLTQLFRCMTLGLVLASMPLVGGCTNTGSWQEEVKLSDGRVIVVTQKRRYEGVYTGQNFGDLPREFWLTFRLPEFGDQEITWHENLKPLVLNLYQGHLYLIATPPSGREFMQYGSPKPGYVQFKYDGVGWKRVPFSEIPEAIYDTNLLIANGPPNNAKFVLISMKSEEIKDETLGDSYKRITSKWVIN